MNHRQIFLNTMAQTSDFPLSLEIEKAEGVYLTDKNGKNYMDLISGIAVSNVGHRHPEVLQAIHNQLDKYMHLMVYGEYVQSPQVLLAQALVQTLHPAKDCCKAIDNIYFTNSGTEAAEGAMKLAKRYTGRQEIISCFNAYHGASQGALSLAGSEHFKQNFRPLLPAIRHINYGNIADIEHITEKTAAVFIEPVAGEAGVRTASLAYWQLLRKKCKETGTLLIMDEIQTGFGRTGSFWAFEQLGIYPDVLLAAKGMGGGMPIGAFMAPKAIMKVFTDNPILGHITTFGGHPVSCAASLATLQIINNQNLIDKINEKSEFIRSNLYSPLIKEIRNVGLMMAVEFESFDVLKPIIDKAIENGIITDWFLFCDHSMRLAPPLTISMEELEKAVNILNAVLASF